MKVEIDIPKEILKNPRMAAYVARDYLRALVNMNRLILRMHPEIPLLYHSRVKYMPEPQRGTGLECFDNVHQVFTRGNGDCDDLVAWRAAEILEREGRPAEPLVYWRPRKKGGRWHFQVRHWPNKAAKALFAKASRGDKRAIAAGGLGEVEDPSRLLGM